MLSEASVRVLLTGANGIIGSAIASALVQEGHEVVSVTRSGIGCLATIRSIAMDARDAMTIEAWLPHLGDVDAVVNCMGVLQDSARDSTSVVHAEAPAALFAACAAAGVRRVIQISAIGSDHDAPTAFSRSKAKGDAALMASRLEWVILRPSVVLGPGAYGGSALFRALAVLPVLPRLPGAGKLQVVQLPDLVSTVLFFLRRDAPARVALEIVGPDQLSYEEVVDTYRTWMGGRPARRLRLPPWIIRCVFVFGDLGGWLGWRPPIRSTAAAEISRGAIGDPGPWTAATGITPTSLRQALISRPASVQEKWFARLFLIKPVVLVSLSIFWIATALISLGPGWTAGIALMHEGGVKGVAAPATVIAGALADLAIGIGIAWRRTAKHSLYVAIALSLVYALIGTALLPRLWVEPLGPLLKILPVLMVHLVALATLEDR
jgi:uncharacterized protein YbjT (DUF2867 family)